MKKLMSIVVIFAGLFAHAVGINTKSNANCMHSAKLTLSSKTTAAPKNSSTRLAKPPTQIKATGTGTQI